MRLKNYRHLIWDWNGTLLDDAWLCRDIMNGQLRRRGLPVLSQEKYEEIFDFPVEKYYGAIVFLIAKVVASAIVKFVIALTAPNKHFVMIVMTENMERKKNDLH